MFPSATGPGPAPQMSDEIMTDNKVPQTKKHLLTSGAAIGAALLPAVAEAVSHGSPAGAVSGDRTAMLTAAVAAALATVVAWRGGLTTRSRLHPRHTF